MFPSSLVAFDSLTAKSVLPLPRFPSGITIHHDIKLLPPGCLCIFVLISACYTLASLARSSLRYIFSLPLSHSHDLEMMQTSEDISAALVARGELLPYKEDFYLWKYVPSKAAAIIFTLFFLVLSLAHTWKMVRQRM